jgi:hypothetical protein
MHRYRSLVSPRALLALALAVGWLGLGRAADKTPAGMADAATRLVAALSPEQQKQAVFPFEGAERLKWHFIPTEMFARNGLTIQAMTEPQRKLAHALLQSALSQRGYLTATAIMDLETVLRAIETNGRFDRNPELYFFSVFGTPGARGAWGWRVEGHHLSLHFTVVNGTVMASAPLFFGTNPAEVRDGPKKGLRILGAQEDAARALLLALDAKQRSQAIVNEVAPNDIVTMNTLDIDPLSPAGLRAAAMTPAQRDLLMRVVDGYVSMMAPDVAADRMASLKRAGIDALGFAWAGEAERGKRHYFRVQGPTFLLEWDNTQNDGNHVHSVWRDFAGDFGRDLLREHLKTGH